jgi:hypothetical protein
MNRTLYKVSLPPTGTHKVKGPKAGVGCPTFSGATLSSLCLGSTYTLLFPSVFIEMTFEAVVNSGKNLKDFASSVTGIKKTIKDIEVIVGRDCKLPQALYASYSKGISKKQILNEWKIKKRDWDFVHDLVNNDEIEMMEALAETPEGKLPWISEIELKYETLDVILDSHALEDMLLSVLETYKVPKGKGSQYTEVYGLCLGMVRQISTSIRGSREHQHQRIHVVRAAPQIRAQLNPTWCMPNDNSRNALLEASNVLFPQYEVVGEYHSHPFISLSELIKRTGWVPSQSDYQSMPGIFEGIQEQNHRLRVSFIIAIAKGKETSSKGQHKNMENVLRLVIGGCHVFVAAYRILSGGILEQNPKTIRLHCPTITGLR